MKLKHFLAAINLLVEINPQALEHEVIYSHDDEGNEYQKVNSVEGECQVQDLKISRDLEIVGFAGDDIDERDLNAICIN